jgi:hypothetical protein
MSKLSSIGIELFRDTTDINAGSPKKALLGNRGSGTQTSCRARCTDTTGTRPNNKKFKIKIAVLHSNL